MPPKVLYFAPEDWAFLEHFTVTGRAAQQAGFQVTVATRVTNHRAPLEALGFNVLPLDSERSNLGPFYNLLLIARMIGLIRATKPNVVHCIGLRMVVLAGVAAKLAGVRNLVLLPTGLVYFWINDGWLNRLLRSVIRVLVSKFLNGPTTEFIFENDEDPVEIGLSRNAPNLTIIGGVGVAPLSYPCLPAPGGDVIKVAVVARMLKGKGIAESVAAVQRVRSAGVPLELHLYGGIDASSRMTLDEATLRGWERPGGVVWHGRVSNIAAVWATHHIAMLLSYREGLPRSLIEAAAAGRPIITTDVVGCRSVITDQVEGFIVPMADVEQPAACLLQLATDAELRVRMGAAAHRRFMERFTADAVQATILAVYRSIASR